MSQFDGYRAQMQAENRERDALEVKAALEIATLLSLLSEWIAKPHSYGQKKELLERTALIVEGWEEV